MGQGQEQARPRPLAIGQAFDLRRRIQVEGLPQFLRVRIIPPGIEGARVTQKLIDAHPTRQVRLLGEVADASQHSDGVLHGIPAEDAHDTRSRH